jgi:hypothetical protein
LITVGITTMAGLDARQVTGQFEKLGQHRGHPSGSRLPKEVLLFQLEGGHRRVEDLVFIGADGG